MRRLLQETGRPTGRTPTETAEYNNKAAPLFIFCHRKQEDMAARHHFMLIKAAPLFIFYHRNQEDIEIRHTLSIIVC